MKIIASTNNGILLEASKEEVALILGFRNTYSSGFSNDMLNIGKDIPINKIDKISRFVRTLEEDKLMSIKQNLKEAIADIDKAVETTQEITLFATLSEEDKS